MNKSNIKKILVISLLLMCSLTLFLTCKSYSNKSVIKDIEEHLTEREEFSMYVQNLETKEYEKDDSGIFPVGYNLNLEKSKCFDYENQLLEDSITYANNKISIKSNKSMYCQLYFDYNFSVKDVCSYNDFLGACITNGVSKIDSINDESLGELYRFTGTNDVVNNNYICFGTSDKNKCIAEPDKYMYRIIGVVSGDVNTSLGLRAGDIKLIKDTSVNTYWWNETLDDVSWENSSMYNYLQNNILVNENIFSPYWITMINKVKWYMGDAPDYSSGNSLYNGEVTSVTTESSKLGLVYMSDHYYASTDKGVINCGATLQDCDNWLTEYDIDFYTMTRLGKNPNDSSHYAAYFVSSIGGTDWGMQYYSNVRPVFYLLSSAKYISGDGTKTNPIIIYSKKIVINNDDASTSDPNVTLTFYDMRSDIVEMCIADTSSCTNWIPYQSTYNYTLSSGDGDKYVYAQFRDKNKNTIYSGSDSITLERLTIESVPSQSGSLTYNGSSQSPTWSNYDSSMLKISGQTSGTNAGSYIATFTPASNYQWSDGTTSSRSVEWTINKATPNLSVSHSFVELSSVYEANVTINTNSDGIISASSNDTSCVSVFASGNILTVSRVRRSCTTSVNVQVTSSSNYNDKSTTFDVSTWK